MEGHRRASHPTALLSSSESCCSYVFWYLWIILHVDISVASHRFLRCRWHTFGSGFHAPVLLWFLMVIILQVLAYRCYENINMAFQKLGYGVVSDPFENAPFFSELSTWYVGIATYLDIRLETSLFIFHTICKAGQHKSIFWWYLRGFVKTSFVFFLGGFSR